MSRFEDFTQFPYGVADDINVLLEQSGVTVDVFRSTYSTGAGFSSEVGTATRYMRILAVISQQGADNDRNVESDVRISSQDFLGFTSETDVMINDLWRVGDVEYKVTNVNRSYENMVEVTLTRGF